MKLIQIVLFLTFCAYVLCSEEPRTSAACAVTESFEDAETCCQDDDDDGEFDDAYDTSQFFTELSSDGQKPHKNKTDAVLNCFGLGGGFSKIMDNYFKKDANGTKALKVLFYSSSRKQPERVTMRHGDRFLLDKIDFNIRRRTIFIVHGFLSDGKEQWIADMEKALLKWADVNIFVVDWSDGANTWNYLKAAVNTKTVGDQIATFVGQIASQIIEWDGPSPDKWGPLHLIGHSLGAHICGFAAREIRQRNHKWPVHRITGLDPAQPCFKNSDLKLRLDRSDAHLVDVIHTNGKILKKIGLGLPFPLGHVDFYPNGGTIQPGCILTKSSIWNYIPLPVEKIQKTICSHGRSYLYLTESIIAAVERNCTFWAHEWDMSYTNIERILLKKCDYRLSGKCMEMGINAERYNYNGTFFALTGGSFPYCSVDSNAIKEVQKFMEKLKKNDLFDVQ